MKPWKHAERSAASMGGDFAAHLPSHAFLDRTKDAYAQVSHRFLLHSADFGAECLRLALPDGPDADLLVASHLADDLGRSALMAEWLAEIRPELLPRFPSGPLAGLGVPERAAMVARRLRLPDEALALRVCAFLASPDRLAPDAPPEARRTALRNSFGIGLAEACLGAVHALPDGRRIGTRDLAEADVLGDTGCILPYAAVAKAVRLRPWMAGGA